MVLALHWFWREVVTYVLYCTSKHSLCCTICRVDTIRGDERTEDRESTSSSDSLLHRQNTYSTKLLLKAMSKTALASGKSKRPSTAAVAAAAGKADHNAANAIVIGKKRPATTIALTSSSLARKKKTATATTTTTKKATPMPLPGGWPVSSKFPYPAADHRHERHDDRPSPPTHLRPGGLLRRSCNGSDVFLRKRAVQSASASLFNVAKAGGGGT